MIADLAYATGVIRNELRRRRITAVIPEKRDQIAARARRGSRGGRPPAFDAQAYRGRNVVERHFALAKQWRGDCGLTQPADVVAAALLLRRIAHHQQIEEPR